MKYKIVRWYYGIRIETFVPNFEEAYQEYTNDHDCDTIQVYFLKGDSSILLAQQEYK